MVELYFLPPLKMEVALANELFAEMMGVTSWARVFNCRCKTPLSSPSFWDSDQQLLRQRLLHLLRSISNYNEQCLHLLVSPPPHLPMPPLPACNEQA